MFGFFNKRSSNSYQVNDKIWLSKQAKWNFCADMLKKNPQCLFIAWFEATKNELQTFLGTDSPVILTDQLMGVTSAGRMIVFVEHYPLPEPEEKLFETLNLNELPVLSSLDEPIFRIFGGEKLISLIEKLGFNEKEVLGHSMITRSIKNAQGKLAEKVKLDNKARSQEEWFALNYQV